MLARGDQSIIWQQTTMTNPYLVQEIIDYTIDLLHDDPETLKRCCLVSKSWVPRTRKHLFSHIQFRSPSDLEAWKKTFTDVANPPAYHVRTLVVGCPRFVTASDAEEGGWIRAFSGVTSLEVNSVARYDHGVRTSDLSLVPFHEFSPTLKSLHLSSILLPYPALFDFILSFPLLEDLGLSGYQDPQFNGDRPHQPQPVITSTSPPLTGSLDFHLLGGAGDVARRLLDLPGGLHFRKLALSRDQKADLWWITELVMRCSRTLESLEIIHARRRTFIRICVRTDDSTLFQVDLERGSFDLSMATNLRDLVFRPESQSAEWITMALQTITPEHRDLQRISIHMPYYLTLLGVGVGKFLGEATCREWSDLDRLLVQFWESRSIRPRVGCVRLGQKQQSTEYCIGCLLPEITKRGIFDSLLDHGDP